MHKIKKCFFRGDFLKKVLSKIIMLAALVTLCITMSACNILTIYVPKDNGKDPSSVTDGVINATETFGETYKVKSVSLKTQSQKGEAKTRISATADVYESVVTIRAGVSGGTQIGSGVMVDIEVVYEDAAINEKDFVYIVTCHHVIEGSNAINAYIPKCTDTATGEYDYYELAFAATLMGSDKETDIAVLRIEINDKYDGFGIDNVKKAPIANYNLERGEDIFAIGCPTGELPGTASYGSVSNLYVDVSVKDVGDMVLHQTDTATNQGNSGGGIFNYAGQLVGILNAGATEYDGISFFIPITGETGVNAIASCLIETVTDENYGYIAGKWKLGASFSETRVSTGPWVAPTTYLYVTSIDSDSAFGKAGITANSFIFSISYNLSSETKTCNMSSLDEFKEFYEAMQKDLNVGDGIEVVYGSSVNKKNTVKATLTQYIYNSKANAA